MKKRLLKLIAIITTITMLAIPMIGCSAKDKYQIPILMYHHFDDVATSGAVVAKEEFKKQIDYLKANGFNTITFQELIDFKAGKIELPEKPVVITSDDGYLSNYDFMYPILKENDMKATIFLIGDRIDNAKENIEKGTEIPKFDWAQAKEMYESDVIDLQPHTYDSHHKDETVNGEKGVFSAQLKDESEEDYRKRIEKDLQMNIEGIEKNLGYKPNVFSYPFGENSEIAEEVLKENGIEASVTVVPGMVTEKDEDTHLLNRVTVSGNDDMDTFIKKVNGEI